MSDNALLDPPPGVPRDRHLAREWMSMGLYISISLLAAIGTIVETGNPERSPLPALWGILAGLVIAHTFAFSLASIATATGDTRREDLLHVGAGLAGAISVGLLITAVSLLLPAQWETLAITIALTAYIGAAAGVIARSRKAGWWRTVMIVAIVLVVAVGIILVKNLLGAH